MRWEFLVFQKKIWNGHRSQMKWIQLIRVPQSEMEDTINHRGMNSFRKAPVQIIREPVHDATNTRHQTRESVSEEVATAHLPRLPSCRACIKLKKWTTLLFVF